MTVKECGSTWNKWDLHVHTPESIVHNYPGEKESAWEAFIADLEALPSEFKVIGINDYLFVDGYERVLREKKNGRLANIDLFLPIVELRLDKFGGVLEKIDDSYIASPWSRINLHVIFDQVDPALIREQFMPALSRTYRLAPGSNGQWGGVITRENLIALGEKVIASIPVHLRNNAPTPLKAGFNNLNVTYEDLKDALNTPYFKGKHLIAIGKSEWDSLRWNDSTIADKKTVINDADLVFISSANPAAYDKAKNALKGAEVNARLLDCSDAHCLSSSTNKDRIGNCFSWIKANPTFQGLLQALEEFEERIFVGDEPTKRRVVQQNKTKFIKSVKVVKKEGLILQEPWFDSDLPLSSDLVAIIGNKGSGKSALSDAIALAGNTRNHKGFSFLQDTRFRNPKTKFAQNFEAILTWHDEGITKQDLDKNPDASSVERVKYLPQSYLEGLCNELGDGGSATFDAELRKIIYSHVPESERLGMPSMDELLEFKVSEINNARRNIRNQLSELNNQIIALEKRGTPEFRKSLEEQLLAKKRELASLEAGKPQPVENPNDSEEVLAESKLAAEFIDNLERQLKEIDEDKVALKERQSIATKKMAIATRIIQALNNHKKQYDVFIGELNSLVSDLNANISSQSLIELKLDFSPVQSISILIQNEIEEISSSLTNALPGSLNYRREELVAAIFEAKNKLGEQERLFVVYKEELSNWEKLKSDVIGSIEKLGTIAWLEAQINSLATIPLQLAELKAKRRDFSREIHRHIKTMVDEYQRLYGPVQSFVDSDEQKEMNLPLSFRVQIEQSDFQSQFLNWLNRQVKGSFSGIDDSYKLVRDLLNEVTFASVDEAIIFADKIDNMLHFDCREGQNMRETKLEDQLRRGADSQDVLDYVYGFEYLSPKYSLTFDGQDIGQLSPGERGLLLLVFYLLVDKDDIPIVIDQPEENLDNQTIFKILVKCLKKAKARRQVVMVTHNPNLAVVCDAEQIIYASCDKINKRFEYESGAIENPDIKSRVVEILEGTEPAFKNRQSKYRLQ